MNNKLIISSAGSGKTTFIVNEALKIKDEQVLITTYTEANESEIKRKLLKKNNCIPSNITVQTWFSFLLQHGVRPYQGSFNSRLFNKNINGMILVEGGQSGIARSFVNRQGRKINVLYREETNFIEHYFTPNMRIYSDKISKFIFKCAEKTDGELITRISCIYPNIFIDEVQDLAGYDYELLKLLFSSRSKILLVGDPRQVTYLTNHSSKNRKYKNGKIKEFINDKCSDSIEIDEQSLLKSHRNHIDICKYSSRLYPDLLEAKPCDCNECREEPDGHTGIFLIKGNMIESYLQKYNPVQLRWNSRKKVNVKYQVYTYGKSKGLTFARTLIYPTASIKKWIEDNNSRLEENARAKFYVALTRARYSVAIVDNSIDVDMKKIEIS